MLTRLRDLAKCIIECLSTPSAAVLRVSDEMYPENRKVSFIIPRQVPIPKKSREDWFSC